MLSRVNFTLPHLLDLAAHIGAGIAAIGLGMAMLAGAKGTPGHRRRGRLFAALTLARVGQPWSQLLPSVLGMAVVAFLIWREVRMRLRSRVYTTVGNE